VRKSIMVIQLSILRSIALVLGVLVIMATVIPTKSQAIPIYARQTGQKCVACHAGGLFPELNAFGRMFKLNGYTMGERVAVPLSVMGTISMTKVASTTPGSGNPQADFPQNGGFPHFTTASIFAGGKITDKVGLFGQWTYNAYNGGPDNYKQGHSSTDQFDLRYSDHLIGNDRDLIIGVSLNNNPGVTDAWNTFSGAFASTPGYVPAGNPTGVPGAAAIPQILGLGPVAAGIDVYGFLNGTVYAEIGGYQTANGALSFLSQGISDANMGSKLKGKFNPYWRLALNHDWDASSSMVGLFGLSVKIYPGSPDTTGPTNSYRDIGIDGQYQYILDPDMFSAQFSYIKENQSYDASLVGPGAGHDNSSNTLGYLRLKGTYVYQAKFGGSLGYVSGTGSSDAQLYNNPTPLGSANNTPNTRFWVPEVFWTPVQNVRVGIQYYKVTEFNGSSNNYDGNGRNASDNNTLFFYFWGAI
jgi:hypothetical protein